ncbi:hypothetical protein [uncultured Chitinophaga sp.]|uniref:hypothetical protein n=1 Tax=uncultured Chitinophaga sp. TaxID=339340 RepID=UPI0025E89EFC|nr:hypothetical protein [uncultured Chitinophaga sp.]
MTRQITIKMHGDLIMADLEFEKTVDSLIYRIKGNKRFFNQVPDGFAIVKEDNSGEFKYDRQELSEEGLYIVQQVCAEIKCLPEQFQGTSAAEKA